MLGDRAALPNPEPLLKVQLGPMPARLIVDSEPAGVDWFNLNSNRCRIALSLAKSSSTGVMNTEISAG
jgi:hypothetical protein